MVLNSIVGKLWATIIILLLVTFIILGFVLSQMMENFYVNLQAEELIHQGKQLSDSIGNQENPQQVLDNLDFISSIINASIMVLDRRGLVQACSSSLGISPGVPYDNPDLDRVIRGDIIMRKGLHPVFDAPMMSVAVPIFQNKMVIGGVFLDAPLAPITQTVENIRDIIFYAAAATIAVATVLAFFLSKSISHPLIQMNNAALAMAKGDFSQQVDVITNDEVGTLGNTLNYLGTELEQNIDALTAEKTQLANILASMTEGVISFDQDGRVVTLNPPAQKLLSLTEDVLPGKALPDSNLAITRLYRLFAQVIEEENWIIDELVFENHTLSIKMAPIKGVDEIIGVVAVIIDITKEKKLDQMRREFVANVSHELRTPLSFLQGYAEAILDGMAQSEEERENYVQIILDETLRLRRLVNELLDITQMESGQLPLELKKEELANLIGDVKRKLEPLATELKIDFQVILPKLLPPVLIDFDRIEQALINLLDNAFRYTGSGGQVTVEVSDEPQFLSVKVRDTGQGIPAKELPYIFERFYKVDKSRNRANGGTGLGLAIVKNIINAHDQTIRVNSEVGKGTEFIFTLLKAT
jgi:two-component system sensor histidine kinase ResE